MLRHDRTVQHERSAVLSAKSALRRRVLTRRATLSPEQLAAAGPALADAVAPVCRRAGCVAVYAAVGSEPPTAPLLDALVGLRVLLPVLLPGGDLDWAEHRPGVDLARSERGLWEPVGPRLGTGAVRDCDVVVVPALAVDRAGRRLGRGGGSYDRALTRARGLVVALLHDGELLDAVPTDPHDVGVAAVATPAVGLLRLDQASGPAGSPGTMDP